MTDLGHPDNFPTASRQFDGRVERVEPVWGMEGWIIVPSKGRTAPTLQMYCGDQLIAEVHCDPESAQIRANMGQTRRYSFHVTPAELNDLIRSGVDPKAELRLYFAKRKLDGLPQGICLQWFDERARMIGSSNTSSESISDSSDSEVRAIAFYLPQYHPIPENDQWWGKGFSEWTNVSQARPMFPGHYQPRIPGDLGFYDLRLAETRQAQAEMAKEYGIHGFCYYYYWFSGKRLLEKPLEAVLSSGQPDFPFCICWANETWSRRWDGSEHEILMRQIHNAETDKSFILDAIPILKDPRYIRVNGAALLLVYRVGLFPDPQSTSDTWRKIARENGVGELYLCAVESFGIRNPENFGFDASCEFPPHNNPTSGINSQIVGLSDEFEGGIFDYEEYVARDLSSPAPPYKRFKGLMLSWDNSARRKGRANLFVRSTPSAYETWLTGAIELTKKRFEGEERLVFINAWNEWAEGTHLEPDRKYGRAYLEATRRALRGESDIIPLIKSEAFNPDNQKLLFVYERLMAKLALKDKTIAFLKKDLLQSPRFNVSKLRSGLSRSLMGDLKVDGFGYLDRVGIGPFKQPALIRRDQITFFQGWSFAPEVTLDADTPSWLVLRSSHNHDDLYSGLIGSRYVRDDVARAFPTYTEEISLHSGFSWYFDSSEVEPGLYDLMICYQGDELVLSSTPISKAVVVE